MKNAIKNILPIILIISILTSTFSFTIYFHHCSTEGKTTASINYISKCHHQNPNEKCTCSLSEFSQNNTNKQNLPTQNITISIKDECCTFSAQDTARLQANLFSDVQKSITNSNIYRTTVDFITNSSIYNHLENQYKEINTKIFQPINKFILLIHKITSYKNSDSDKEENNS